MRNPNRYTIVRKPNRHGTTMLRGRRFNETVFVVECADSDVRNVLDGTAVGTDVRVELERVGRRGNAWRATAAQHAGSSSADPPC